jgi:nitrite reductase/ring-hydroxylating ferredoxin subunit
VGVAASATGPDFSQGIDLSEIPTEGTVSGRVGDDSVLLSRLGGELFAIGGTCTHYGGNLGDGISRGTTVRCPLHHACFDLRTGAVLRAPALDPVERWKVVVDGDRAFVRSKIEKDEAAVESANPDIRNIVIVGGGVSGLGCAHELRRLGFIGEVTILSADPDAPCDRPNLSKDYLAGNMPEEWVWLRMRARALAPSSLARASSASKPLLRFAIARSRSTSFRSRKYRSNMCSGPRSAESFRSSTKGTAFAFI